MNEYITSSNEETFKIGRTFATTLQGGDIVLMYGELGAGKTVFVKYLGKELKFKEKINSPPPSTMIDLIPMV